MTMWKKSRAFAAVAVLLVVSGCGTPEFKEFSSKDGRFKILMPGTPKEQTQKAVGVDVKLYMVETRQGAYMASYADMPVPTNESDEQIQTRLDGARDGSVRNVNAKLLSTSNITLGKCPGRSYDAELPGGKGVVRGNIYMSGTRLYQVMVVGTKSFVDSADSKKFLDSFAITN
jgi:hypothetical protein